MDKDYTALLRRLRRPGGPVDAVLDTDTYNEIDDQFALSYMIRSEEKIRVRGLYAAPFFNRNSEVFYVRTYPFGGDRWWGDMCDSLDTVELYRKISAYPDVKVTPDELRMMRSEVRPYSAW